MALSRKPKTTEVICRYQRKYGKHRIRTSTGVVTIKPGDIIEAKEGSYVGNQWECLGPVEGQKETSNKKAKTAPEEEDEANEFKGLIKEQRPDGFYVVNPNTGKSVNLEPISEEEADLLVSKSKERS